MRSKKTVRIVLRVTEDHIQKLNSLGIKNKSEVIRRCIDKTLSEPTTISQNA